MHGTIKVILSLGLLFALFLPLNGCYDMVEINDRAYVRGIGMDTCDKEGCMLYTFQVADPSSEGGKGCINVPIIAVNLSEAVRELNRNSAKEINFEHLSAIVLGEEMVRKGFVSQMDYIFRDASFRRSAVLVGCEGKAQDLLQSGVLQGNVAQLIEALLFSYDEGIANSFLNSTLHRIYMQLCNELDYYIVKIRLTEEDKLSGEQKQAYSQPAFSQQEQEDRQNTDTKQIEQPEEARELSFPDPAQLEQSVLSIDGAYTYRENRFAGTLTKRELDTARLILADQKSGILSLTIGNKPEDVCSFRMTQAKAKSSCVLQEDGHFVYHMQISMACYLTQEPYGQETDEAFLQSMQETLQKLLRDEVYHLWNLARDVQGCDFLSFKKLAQQKYHRWMETFSDDWKGIFQNAELEVEVEVDVSKQSRLL